MAPACTQAPEKSRSRWLILLLGLAVLFPVAAMQPVEAEAAGKRSCTGWRSTTVPPKTIRVGRNGGRGPVQTVNFRKYVAVVMSREWPAHLPRAAREAGAVAVKQYAWYHALAGNHRPSFRTASGKCFDVVDSTRDQLYKPEKVGRVKGGIWQAVDATWGLSLRKGNKFFMTGYRRGSVKRCGASADGRRLFARGVIACARNGMSREKIQRRYYGSNLRLVWAGRGSAGASISAAASEPQKPKKAQQPKKVQQPKKAQQPKQVQQKKVQQQPNKVRPASGTAYARPVTWLQPL